MKKILCLFLAVMMLISLCGCFGSNEPDNVRGDISGETGTQSTGSTEGKPEFSLGKATNNTYTNAFLGMGCALPAEWVFYTDEQILEINNIVGDVVDEDIAERLENADIIYDMFATYEAEGSSINVNLEKFNALQMITLDIKQVLESQIDTIKTAYQNMGYTDTNVVYEKITVDGKEFDGLTLTAKILGIDFYATIFSFAKGNYLANVSICSLETDKTDAILSYFTMD